MNREIAITSSNEVLMTDRVLIGWKRKCLTDYKDSGATAGLFAMVNLWYSANILKDRERIGRTLLKMLCRENIADPEVVLEILHFVGTPVCTCPNEAWAAVERFLGPDSWLAVNYGALEAAQRLLHRASNSGYDDVRPSLFENVIRLANHADADIAKVATSVLQLLNANGS